MTANRWVLCLFLAGGLVSGYVIAQANRGAAQIRLSGQETGNAGEGLELLSGNFECIGFTEGPPVPGIPSGITLSFSGTAGITPTTLAVGGAPLTDAPDAAKLCEALGTSMLAHAQGLGCTTGQVRSHADAFSAMKSFKLAFQGKREDVVQVMGELARKLLAESP